MTNEELKKLRTEYRREPPKFVSKEQMEAELDRKLAAGEITSQEAEDEWQDFMHRGMDSFQGVYGW